MLCKRLKFFRYTPRTLPFITLNQTNQSREMMHWERCEEVEWKKRKMNGEWKACRCCVFFKMQTDS